MAKREQLPTTKERGEPSRDSRALQKSINYCSPSKVDKEGCNIPLFCPFYIFKHKPKVSNKIKYTLSMVSVALFRKISKANMASDQKPTSYYFFQKKIQKNVGHDEKRYDRGIGDKFFPQEKNVLQLVLQFLQITQPKKRALILIRS